MVKIRATMGCYLVRTMDQMAAWSKINQAITPLLEIKYPEPLAPKIDIEFYII